MFDRTPESIEMRTPSFLSAAVHVGAIVAAIVNFHFFDHAPLEPEPVMVEFEAIAPKAAAPKVGVQDPQPEKAKIAEETTKAPPPKTASPPPSETPKPEVAETKPVVPPPPVEKPKVEPPKPQEDVVALKKAPEPPKEEKKPDPKPEPPKPPEVKKEVPKPPQPKQQPKKDPVDSLVDSILKNEDKNPPIKTPQTAPKQPKEITRQAPMAPQLAKVVTASEIEGVRAKIRPCWNPTPGAREAPVVSLVVQMNQDGTPVKVEYTDSGRLSDPVYYATAEAARSALLNPRCQPWPLPADRYSGWRTITFNFDPRDY